jgi:predicted DNA binding CopG/RHH family protein
VPSPEETSFAGLLARMTATPQDPELPWNDTLLAEDVTSISYEQALRSHARAGTRNVENLPPSMESENAQTEPEAKAPQLKKASITIRLSEPECAQLRRRASEAGMTVSAYMRSCTFEVESLRAQVKQTLAEIRSRAPNPPKAETAIETKGAIGTLLARLWAWLRELRPKPRPSVPLNPGNPFAPARY